MKYEVTYKEDPKEYRKEQVRSLLNYMEGINNEVCHM